jgi:hypothetical protein
MLEERRAPVSNRGLVLRFAGYVAHLLNDAEIGVVNVRAFAIYKTIMAALEARELASAAGRYDALIGRNLLGPGVGADEAAETYFEQVLKRPLCLARDQHMHKGHELFLALCRRGLDDSWRAAELQRGYQTAAPEPGCDLAPDVRGVFDRLANLEHGLSNGNPAKSTRVIHGALHLHVAGRTALVAEEMSVWDAICCAPLKLRALERGAEFHAFCSIVIKAVETANAHYGTLLSLGLSPRDWRDLSLNTAKKTSAFLSKARELARATQRVPQAGEVWREAWLKQQVPGYLCADDFRESELGQALLAPQTAVWVESDVEDVAVPSREENVLDAVSFEHMLALAEASGLVRPCEVRVLVDLYLERTTLEQIAAGADARDLLGAGALASRRAVAEHLRRLVARIRAHADKMQAAPRDARRQGSIPMMTRDELPAE